LLDAAAGTVRSRWMMTPTGLFYPVPMLIGVRKMRMRTSQAGIMLLDHWAKTFPRFAAFMDAYVSKKARKNIAADCYDLAIGVRPASFQKMDEVNKLYLLKAESRELRRMKQEIAAKEAENLRVQQMMLASQMQQAAH